MSVIENMYKELGHNGPTILIFLSTYLLWDHSNVFFYYIIGIVVNLILNIVLKGLIQQPRPNYNSKDVELILKNNRRFFFKDGIPYNVFGMPSGHSSSVIFSTIFVYLALKKSKWLYVYLIISAIVVSERIVYQHHTISQVIVGSFVGVLVAYFIFQLCEKKLKGRIREKPDDNGPI